ncbi:hypothetical protein L1887_09471 [Cichorium endivia]|nr:hypothetical protein L1887_09471 [Cichorium endivia]
MSSLQFLSSQSQSISTPPPSSHLVYAVVDCLYATAVDCLPAVDCLAAVVDRFLIQRRRRVSFIPQPIRRHLYTRGMFDSAIRWLQGANQNVVFILYLVQPSKKSSDAFDKLSNTKTQFQPYVFDVIRAFVPKHNLDDTFEQKNEIAKAVEQELEKT